MAEHEYYLTYDDDGTGMIAVITRGHIRLGDERCEVLDVERVKNPKEAKRWFRRMLTERPWEPRN